MPDIETGGVLYLLFFRAGKGDRWRRLGRFGTRGEALTAARGKGEFWIREQRAGATASLFDAIESDPTTDTGEA